MLSAAQLGFLLLNRNEVAAAMPLLERALQSSDDDVVRSRPGSASHAESIAQAPGNAAVADIQ